MGSSPHQQGPLVSHEQEQQRITVPELDGWRRMGSRISNAADKRTPRQGEAVSVERGAGGGGNDSCGFPSWRRRDANGTLDL